MMIPCIAAVLTRFKTDWAAQLQPDAILAVCQEAGYTSWRDRVLTPVTTVQLFLLQILHGNTACSHLPHLSGLRFSAAAYCQARARLPLRVFDLLLERFSSAVQPCLSSDSRWHGHRLARYPGVTGYFRPVDGAATGMRRSHWCWRASHTRWSWSRVCVGMPPCITPQKRSPRANAG